MLMCFVIDTFIGGVWVSLKLELFINNVRPDLIKTKKNMGVLGLCINFLMSIYFSGS